MTLTKPAINDLIKKSEANYCADGVSGQCVKIVAVADLPSRFGNFQIVAFYNDSDKKDHVALVHGDVCGKENVPVRLHSECLTGDALGSLRCDCRDQLKTAMKLVGKLDAGVVLYLRQEGRGIGLLNKMKAYQLQDFGYDTVEANQLLGFKDDERDFKLAADMLKALQIKSVKLITNNPKKIKDLIKHGMKVSDRIPIRIPPNEHNREYLKTKMKKSGHMLSELFEAQIDDATK